MVVNIPKLRNLIITGSISFNKPTTFLINNVVVYMASAEN